MSVANLIKEDMQTDAFWVDMSKLEFVTALNKAMKEQGASRADLARSLGKSPAYITKIMQGDANLTIESMVKLARAVGLRYSPNLVPIAPIPARVVQLPTQIYHTKQPERLVSNYGRG